MLIVTVDCKNRM